MDSCPWQRYIEGPASTVEDTLVALPEFEQVARGRELMNMLGKAVESGSNEDTQEDRRMGDGEWNIIVRQTFIEVVAPSCSRSRRRCMSDSALPCFEKADKPWMSLVSAIREKEMSDASTMSEASTNEEEEDLDAATGGDFHGYSSDDGEGEQEVFVQQEVAAVPYQPHVESWWMPINYAACPSAVSTGFDQTSTGFAQAPIVFDQAVSSFEQASVGYDQASLNSFMPMRWADHTVGAVECCGADADADAQDQFCSQEWRTTVMIRNMPNNYTREMLRELVDSMGFVGLYDFAYLPVDFQSQAGLGYAFINFVSVGNAKLCFQRLEGFTNWTVPSEKVCTVTWSSPTQGFEAHIERYKNSPVMHHSLPDAWKPVLLQGGLRVPFPPPSKPIKTPKVRQHPSSKSA